MIIDIDGDKYIALSLDILTGAKERLSFSTFIGDVIDNSKEFRQQLRYYPFTEFQLPLKIFDERQLVSIKELVKHSHQYMLVPDFHESTALVSNDSAIILELDTSGKTAKIGDILRIDTSSGYVYRKITDYSMTVYDENPDDQLNPIERTLYGYKLNDFVDDCKSFTLMHTCLITDEIKYAISYNIYDLSLSLHSLNNQMFEPYDYTLYNGLPYFNFKGFEVIYDGDSVAYETSMGAVYDFDGVTNPVKAAQFVSPQIYKPLNVLLNTLADVITFKKLLCALKGRITDFYMPAFEQQFSWFSISGGKLILKEADFDKSLKHISINTADDQYDAFKILSYTSSNGFVTLTLSSNILKAFNVCPIYRYRLNSDFFEFTYHASNIVEMASSLAELGYE